ncbi:T9SS type A sorting domain-containing protein [bacterium SCSIO 12741]|nr:T9SS type A sorting domain-containing protein [bacterium SCSIO 12741]
MRIWLLVLILINGTLPALAQLSQPERILPWEDAPQSGYVHLDQPLMDDLLEAQQKSLASGTFYPTGKIVPVSINPLEVGVWTLEKNGDRVCRMWVDMEGAQGISLYFEDLFLPVGCELFAFDPEFKDQFGPYTFLDNADGEWVGSGTVHGDKIGLELRIPAKVSLEPNIRIHQIGYQFDHQRANGSRGFGDSDDCQVNVECEEGDNWSNQVRAAVRIKLRYGGFEGWCTGTLMNNTFQDCAPYILTADHCRRLQDGTEATDQEYQNFEFYFLYESTRCDNPNKESDVPVGKLTGCTFKAASGGGGTGGPDFLLLRLNDAVPQFFNPHFAGWDNRNVASISGVMMHHPRGDIKKVATYLTKAESSEWEGAFKDTHWKIFWSQTKNGHSVSQPGSSGAALWNKDGRVVGQLTGGASACEEATGVSPFFPDYFGKMSYNWTFKPQDSTANLYNWLDEGGSQIAQLNGINWPCAEGPVGQEEIAASVDGPIFFPNPVTEGELQVNIPETSWAGEDILVFYDLLGKPLQEVKLTQFDQRIFLHDLTSGVYVVRLLSSPETYHKIQIK